MKTFQIFKFLLAGSCLLYLLQLTIAQRAPRNYGLVSPLAIGGAEGGNDRAPSSGPQYNSPSGRFGGGRIFGGRNSGRREDYDDSEGGGRGGRRGGYSGGRRGGRFAGFGGGRGGSRGRRRDYDDSYQSERRGYGSGFY